MTDKVRSILKQIDEVLNGSSYDAREPWNIGDARELWNILSGLRGPDDDYTNERYKKATTGVIRLKALPKTSQRFSKEGTVWKIGALFAKDSQESAQVRRVMLLDSQRGSMAHFILHAEEAFEALGLKWNEVNETTEEV